MEVGFFIRARGEAGHEDGAIPNRGGHHSRWATARVPEHIIRTSRHQFFHSTEVDQSRKMKVLAALYALTLIGSAYSAPVRNVVVEVSGNGEAKKRTQSNAIHSQTPDTRINSLEDIAGCIRSSNNRTTHKFMHFGRKRNLNPIQDVLLYTPLELIEKLCGPEKPQESEAKKIRQL